MIESLKNFLKNRYKLLFVLSAIALASWYIYAQKADGKQQELNFQQPEYRDLTKKLEVSGIIAADKKARMRFAAGGKVVYLGAQEGDVVKKWQTIATIDRRSLQKSLEKNLNNYMKERWDWDQQLDDIDSRWINKEEQRTVDKNQWDLENTVLDVEIQDIAISNTVMTSPIDGILLNSPTNVTGVQLLATDIFEIVDPNSLIFKAEIDEEDIAQISKNQSAKLILDAYPDQELRAQVDKIAYQTSQSASGTVFIVNFIFDTSLASQDNPLEKYRLGMNGDIDIELQSKQNILAIPLIAVKQRGNDYFVDLQGKNEEITEKQIQTGLETEEWIEVTSGLTTEDQVLIPDSSVE